jgi:putative membrane-bound dehydrogenase-like protein
MRRLLLLLCLLTPLPATAADANRLSHLDTLSVYHPGRHFPRLVTPQWVGEKDVDAVVVLAIDDMRGHERWERYLRPILERLKKIDGRAPVSIMTCSINPKQPHLARWLNEGLSLETHTIDHPNPLLGKSGLEAARSTYERCIDLLASVPNNRPVAFRVPFCDSLNTPGPRFYAEVFNRVTSKGNFLAIDSSVFNLPTADDPEVPRALVTLPNGQERFRRYVPIDRQFVNYIEDYPYPYVIGNLCWQLPCATPSDWQGFHQFGKASKTTLADMKAGLDIAVRKKGVYCLVFHPYGWIGNDQVVELIDHVVKTHGKKVKFLTFREVHDRINKHLLDGVPLRDAKGQDNGVRLLDLDGDGFMDVVIGNDNVNETRVWKPRRNTWEVSGFPAKIGPGTRFGVLHRDGRVSLLVRDGTTTGVWHFEKSKSVPKGMTPTKVRFSYVRGKWVEARGCLAGLEVDGKPVRTARDGKDAGVRLIDVDGDGVCELVIGNPQQNAVFAWTGKGWKKLPFELPSGTAIVDAAGRDAGLRFVDIDEDGTLDVVFSSTERSSLHLFTWSLEGWTQRVLSAKQGERGALPPITRKGADNGFFVHSRQLIWQNEQTAGLPGLGERRSFNDLLANVDLEARSPVASLRCLKARPGFVVEQMAAEPFVMDPVAMAWGPDGKLWVVEMGDYPLGVDGKGKPGGRVVYLEDTRGKGYLNRRTVFLDNLPFPTGVLPWRKGVLVTCAPDIFYAEDTDGDGKADVRKVLFTGFFPGNQQHRVNTLAWGTDGWVYCANGDSGGRIRSLKTGQVVNISGRDLRIRPDTGAVEAESGQTQFGRSRDDAGNWFGGNNSWPMYHFVLADRYLRRNPHFAAGDIRVQVSTVPGAAPVFPRSRTLPRFNDPQAANRFTSACSPIVYRDDLFGPAFSNSAFVSEPVHNLVHREVLSRRGVTFTSERSSDERTSEFLASTDNWFRPTTLHTGPDGALWVASMYRAVIEHPEWIPRDIQKRLDLRAGHDRGRMYRVYPVGVTPRRIPRLDRLDTAGLVAALDSPSGWQRDLAQMMLLWKADKTAGPRLEKMARSKRPLARLHAICTLDGLELLTSAVLVKTLEDTDWAVRREAVRLSETRVAGSKPVQEALLARVRDADPAVRLQLACSLGEWKDARAGRALGRLLLAEGGDRFVRAAVMSSLHRDNLDAVLEAVLEGGKPPAGLVEALMRQAAAMGHDRATVTLLRTIGPVPQGQTPGWRFDVLAAFLDGLAERGSSLAQLRAKAGKDLATAIDATAGLFAFARKEVGDAAVAQEERVRCVRVLGRGADRQRQDVKLLGTLLQPSIPPGVQSAAVTALGRLGSTEVPALLLQNWKGHAPALRAQVLDVLLQRAVWVPALLAALEKKQVLAVDVDAARRQRLLDQRDRTLRGRAEKAFAGAIAPDRQKVVDAYRPTLKQAGDVARGKAVFAKSCSACHRLEGVGNEVGPDLAALAGKSAEYLLVAILDPNRAVEARYLAYKADLHDGRTFTGLLSAETGTSITLVSNDGKPKVILRKNIESLASTGQSFMPEGLEKEVSTAAMTDLLAYLKAQQPPLKPKSFPGNRPALVKADRDGTLRLRATNAEIYGPRLVLEETYRNLGFWASANDRAVWTVEIPRAGSYEVWLDHACDTGDAGNRFVIEADELLLEGKVASTGSWDTYQRRKVGTVKLPAGRLRMTVRSQGAIRGALMDLRTVELVPVK